jgi:hypothetical protein
MTMAQPSRSFADAAPEPPGRRERRAVTLAAYGTRGDGSLVEMTVVDLSYDGCGVVCSAHLKPGEQISLSVLRRGETPVIVRWVDGTRAGLSFVSDVPSEESSKQPRRHERVSVDGEMGMRRPGRHHFRVHVYDLSPDGCKAEFVERPELGEHLWIKFDGLEVLEANVCWIADTRVGIKFTCTFHPAVFDMLVARLG